MKQINVTLILVCTAMLFAAFDSVNQNETLSTGAPPAHTGAPGEQTCARSGCHTGTAVNSGIGTLTLTYNESINEYIPGQNYEVKVTMEEAGITRFGFELTAISDLTGKEAGSLLVTDSSRMQIMQGPAPQADRRYITYKYVGTNPVALGKGEWIFDWIAPLTDVGPVSFYVAAVSANDDAMDDGDFTYTTSVTIEPTLTLSIENDKLIQSITVYPNPSADAIQINTQANLAQETRVAIYNMNGQIVEQLYFDGCCMELNVSEFETGLYIVEVELNEQTISTRLLIARK